MDQLPTVVTPSEPRPWAPRAATILALLALIPGIGIVFGVASILISAFVLIYRIYTPRQKLGAGLTMLVSITLTIFWLYAIAISAI